MLQQAAPPSQSSSRLAIPGENDDRASVAASLTMVDDFVRLLNDVGSTSAAQRAALSSIQQHTGAQLVLVVQRSGYNLVDHVGTTSCGQAWCREMVRELIESFPTGGMYKPGGTDRLRVPSGGPDLHGAVAVPVDEPRGQWVVLLAFDPRTTLRRSDMILISTLWRIQSGHVRLRSLHDDIRDTLYGIVRCLSTAIDAKDSFTCGHSMRVARIAVRLGQEMNLSRGEVSDLYLAGLLHDVGKIGIRDSVLLKEGELTPEERAHIQEHPIHGERIVAQVRRFAHLRPGVRSHHERYDGKGYPDGLVGEDIPLMARILAVADSCDAMMSDRRYRAKLSEAKIEAIFAEGAGLQWDPDVVNHFMSCRTELYPVRDQAPGASLVAAVTNTVDKGDDEPLQSGALTPRLAR